MRCDKAEPQCLKCRKKGINCSGQGIECRFSSHMIQKSPANPPPATTRNKNPAPTSPPSRAAKRYRWVNMASPKPEERAPGSDDEFESSTRRGSAISSSSFSSHSPLSMEAVDDGSVTSCTPSYAQLDLIPVITDPDQSSMQLSSPRPAIEAVPAQARMLFDHCNYISSPMQSLQKLTSIFYLTVSNFIASKMVVFDFTGNGYRQIILPLACQDEMVGRAVSVIAAFHLEQKAPQMRMAAEIGQQAILSRLSRDSLRLEPERLFSLSTWATILVLLVGTTITGSSNYVHLLELLSCLAQSSASVPSLPETTRTFIMEQTRM